MKFDLVIVTTECLKVAVRKPSGEVAGVVHKRLSIRKSINATCLYRHGNIPIIQKHIVVVLFRSLLRLGNIPPCHTGTTSPDGADLPDLRRGLASVQDIDVVVGRGFPNGKRTARSMLMHGVYDGDLCGPTAVVVFHPSQCPFVRQTTPTC